MINRGAWAEVNLAALRHNYEAIKEKLAKGARLCAVVKADAYGHGAVPAARIALSAGAAYLAVAAIEEAAELRRAGITAPILMLGIVPEEAALDVVSLGVTQTVASVELARALSEAAVCLGRRAKVHLAIETGMGRIGVRPEEVYALARAVKELPQMELEGAFSHFAMADIEDKSFSRGQFRLFQTAVEEIRRAGAAPEICHIAESAAALEMPKTHLDMVRVGIIQYGLWPSDEVARNAALTPVMKLYAQVVFLKSIEKGKSIGYGRAYIADGIRRIATLPIGYADGYIRAYAKAGYVLIHGQKAKIVGRICMDQTMVDVTDIENVKVGDKATLFGEAELSADTLAKWADTINYEVPCLLSKRVPRIYIDEDAKV